MLLPLLVQPERMTRRNILLQVERHEHRLLAGYASILRAGLLADALPYAPDCSWFLSGLPGTIEFQSDEQQINMSENAGGASERRGEEAG